MWLRLYSPFGMMDIYGAHDRLFAVCKPSDQIIKHFNVCAYEKQVGPWVNSSALYSALPLQSISRGGDNIEIDIGRERMLDLPRSMVLPTSHFLFRWRTPACLPCRTAFKYDVLGLTETPC